MRYLKLIFINAKNCLIRIMEFRSEVISWSFFSLFWAFIIIVFTEVLFSQISSIAGWTKNEILVLVMVQELFIGFIWIFILPSVLDYSKSIRKGELDFFLIRPVNTRFLLSFRRFEFDQFLRITVLIFILNIYLKNLGIPIHFENVLLAVLLFALGLFIFYCLFFTISTLSFWFINLFNLEDFFDSVINAGRYPSTIFQGGLRIIFFYILPVVFTATYPTQALLGRFNPLSVIQIVTAAALIFFISEWFWNFALKRYSSASS